MTDLFALCVASGVIIALARWRAAIFLVILVGTLQDPVRKLTPDTPAIMAVTSIPVWLAAWVGAFHRERAWASLRRAWPAISRTAGLFLIALLPATLLVFQHGAGVWRVVVIGLFGYLVPLASVLAGFVFARSPTDIRRVLVFYSLFTAALMSGTLLEYTGSAGDWLALGTEAFNTQWVRYGTGEPVPLMSGFYRSPDVMAWHAAALTMFSLTLALERHKGRGVWPLLAVVGVVALMLGGRRKMTGMPILWCAFIVASYLRFGRASRVVGLLGVTAAAGGMVYFAAGEVAIDQSYYSYAASTTTEASNRFVKDTWGAVVGTFRQTGPLGRGIGSASQGTQHVGFDQARSWQESGLSKLAVELGAPGLICALLLAVAIARACATLLKNGAGKGEYGVIYLALMGFIIANGVSFLISHQVYGDVLVMVLTAFMLGVVLSAPRWSFVAPPARRREPVPFGQPFPIR
jgi:hypothetical protein